MAAKNDKWVMFRNYMHNELGITKEDIQTWIKEAVEQEAKNVVNNAVGKCDLEKFIRNEMFDSTYWNKSLKDDLKQAIAKQFAENIELTLK